MRTHVTRSAAAEPRSAAAIRAPAARVSRAGEPFDRGDDRDSGADRGRRGAPAVPGFDFRHVSLFSTARPRSPSTAPAVQPKLVVGAIDDPLEREADHLAERVMRMAEAPLPPPPPPPPDGSRPGSDTIQRKCATCRDEDEKVQRKPVAAPSAPTAVPSALRSVLRSSGEPLDAATRRYVEPRFGRDFADVRVHADARAARSATELGAAAFTVGSHVVFGPGRYQPATTAGRHLIAHELSHVVQQTRSGYAREGIAQRMTCAELLQADERPRVPEGPVRDAVLDDMQAAFGAPMVRELTIPGGSSSPFKTEPRRRGGPDVIKPTLGAMFGRADIAGVVQQGILNVTEIKRAWHTADPRNPVPDNSIDAGRVQIENYVSKGDDADAKAEIQADWNSKTGRNDTITAVQALPTSLFTPETPKSVNGTLVSLAWCQDGLMGFKAVGDQDKDTFVCGTTDQGKIDAFVDRMLDPAQARLEDLLRTTVEEPALRALEKLTLAAIGDMILQNPTVRARIPTWLASGSDDQVKEALLRALAPIEARIRAFARQVIHDVVQELRTQLQAKIRTTIAAALTAVCVGAAAVTASQVQREFEKRMRELLKQAVPAAIVAVAAATFAKLEAALAEVIKGALKDMLSALGRALDAILDFLDTAITVLEWIVAVIIWAFVIAAIIEAAAPILIAGGVAVLAFASDILEKLLPSFGFAP